MAIISTHTQSLNLCGHSSIELRNTSIGKSAATFRRDRFKLSILICLFLQAISWSLNHSLYSKGFRSELAEGQSEVEMKSGTFVSCHRWVVRTLCAGVCAGAESCWKLHVHGRRCFKKRHLSIESLKLSLRKAGRRRGRSGRARRRKFWEWFHLTISLFLTELYI